MSGVRRLVQQMKTKGMSQVTNEDLEKYGNVEEEKETKEE